MSEQATFDERHTLARRNHEVVKHAHVNQRERLFEPTGDGFVRMARFDNTRRMVVKKNHRCRVCLHGLLHDDARMNRSAIDSALKQLTYRDNPMPVIEKQTPEHFVSRRTLSPFVMMTVSYQAASASGIADYLRSLYPSRGQTPQSDRAQEKTMSLFKRGNIWWVRFSTPDGQQIRKSAKNCQQTVSAGIP